MAHAPLVGDAVGERLHLVDAAVKYRDFQAIVAVEVDVERGHGQVVMVVLRIRQPLGQIPRAVLIDVGQGRETLRSDILSHLLLCLGLSHQISDRFRPARITVPLANPIDRPQQVIINGDSDTLHGTPSQNQF